MVQLVIYPRGVSQKDFPFEITKVTRGQNGVVPLFGFVLLNGIPAQDYATRVRMTKIFKDGEKKYRIKLARREFA